jgi:hypothetical protein
MIDERPLSGYFALASGYAVVLVGALAVARRHRGEFPGAPSALDLATSGVAVYKLSRVIAKDDITAFVRAPFVTCVSSNGELREEPRGSGLRRATGELLTCPLCLAMWCGGALAVGHVGAPGPTRAVAFTLATSAIAELLQLAHSATENQIAS